MLNPFSRLLVVMSYEKKFVNTLCLGCGINNTPITSKGVQRRLCKTCFFANDICTYFSPEGVRCVNKRHFSEERKSAFCSGCSVTVNSIVQARRKGLPADVLCKQCGTNSPTIIEGQVRSMCNSCYQSDTICTSFFDNGERCQNPRKMNGSRMFSFCNNCSLNYLPRQPSLPVALLKSTRQKKQAAVETVVTTSLPMGLLQPIRSTRQNNKQPDVDTVVYVQNTPKSRSVDMNYHPPKPTSSSNIIDMLVENNLLQSGGGRGNVNKNVKVTLFKRTP